MPQIGDSRGLSRCSACYRKRAGAIMYLLAILSKVNDTEASTINEKEEKSKTIFFKEIRLFSWK
jgi:hypothetical protein